MPLCDRFIASEAAAIPSVVTVVISSRRKEYLKRQKSLMRELSEAKLDVNDTWVLLAPDISHPCMRFLQNMQALRDAGWSPGGISLALSNVAIWQIATDCTLSSRPLSSPSETWLLIIEDDADLPPIDLTPFLQDIIRMHPAANVIWLDHRGGHGYSSTKPPSCCTAAVLYRADALPALLARILFFPSPSRAVTSGKRNHSVSNGIDLVLSKVLRDDFPGQSAALPIVGTMGLKTTIQTEKRERMRHHHKSIVEEKQIPWCAFARFWPDWLFRLLVPEAATNASTIAELENEMLGGGYRPNEVAVLRSLRACLRHRPKWGEGLDGLPRGS